MSEEAQYEYYGKFGFTKRNSLVYLGPMVRVCFLTTHNIKINYFILIAENNRHVFGIRLYIGGHFEKIRCPVYGGSTKALNYVGGTICHIDDVEAF